MEEMLGQFWRQLADLGMLPNLQRMGAAQREAAVAHASAHADNPLLLKAVLAAGLFPNVLLVTPGKHLPHLSQQKQSVSVHPSSFNHRCSAFDSSYLVYHSKVKATGSKVSNKPPPPLSPPS